MSTSTTTSKLLRCSICRPAAPVRLICFPWAGGGAAYYSISMAKLFPDTVEVIGVCLAGRENRFKEPVVSSLSELVEQIVSVIQSKYADKPFAFFGHSMGAFLGYETALVLKKRHNLEPIRMFVSGMSAPHSAQRKKIYRSYTALTDEEFLKFIRQLGGTPPEILENKEMMALYYPNVRADYGYLDQVSFDLSPTAPDLTCPLDVFDGEEDLAHDFQSWADVTTGPLSVRKLKGGHFYLKDPDNMPLLSKYISESLQ